mmetsp:Transcript_25096/g.62799  ORF Transcript_25096/g.62799 Transcript_25096/m.62799 type:complete len:211 (-) Transcript_25096:847-1479(-)
MTPTSAPLRLFLLVTCVVAHIVVAETFSRTSVIATPHEASSSGADAQELLGTRLANDGDLKGAVLLLRRALELRTPGNVADLARTKRTLANVLAGFGDGFAMQMPEEFESLVHTREANAMDPPLGRSDAAAEEAGAWPPSPAERSWHAKFEHSGRSEGGVAPGREVRAGWEREFLMERETRRLEAERRAATQQEWRRLQQLHGGSGRGEL